jgi:hypothetical protein
MGAWVCGAAVSAGRARVQRLRLGYTSSIIYLSDSISIIGIPLKDKFVSTLPQGRAHLQD